MITLIKSLWPYFVRYKWYFFWGFLFTLITNIFAIYPALLVRNSFDLVAESIKIWENEMDQQKKSEILSQTFSKVMWYGLGMVLVAFLRGVFLFGVRQSLIVMSRHVEFDQKNDLFSKYLQFSMSNLKTRMTGDLMARMGEDIANVRMFTGPAIMYTLNTIILFFMVLFTMLVVNPVLTFYVLLPLPLLSLTIFWVHSIIIKKSDAVQTQLSVLSAFSQEVFSGIRLIRVFGKEKAFVNKFEQESEIFRQKSMNLARTDALFFPIMLLLVGLSTVLTVWIGGEKVISGEITTGNIAEFILYVGLLTWPIASIGWVTSLVQKAAASQVRINEMLQIKSEIEFIENKNIELPKSYDIHVEHLNFTYSDTKIKAVQDVSFQLKEGQTLGIVGQTGSGKTSLVQLIMRLLEKKEGNILIDGKPIESYSEEDLVQSYAYVPQDLFLFSDSIKNNIAFGLQTVTEEKIKEAAIFAGVWDDICRFPEGLNTIVGERGVTLSGGQKQRISLARAYLMQAKILILDDSISAVDAKTEEYILRNLKSLTPKPTLIVISHRLSAVQHADLILVMKDGSISEQGIHEQLINLNGWYADVWKKQQTE